MIVTRVMGLEWKQQFHSYYNQQSLSADTHASTHTKTILITSTFSLVLPFVFPTQLGLYLQNYHWNSSV